jgi:ABC-type Zn uptake system ZnuABC Zn-binding protein ZnuA
MTTFFRTLARPIAGLMLVAVLYLAACSDQAAAPGADNAATASMTDHEAAGVSEILPMPTLEAAALQGEKLEVVATTSIIGDVVGQVGGGSIELTTLMGPAQDPHSYQPAARDLTAVAEADVVFINGWDLEESLANDLQNIAASTPVVPISAGIRPLAIREAAHESEGTNHEHGAVDPHVWFDIQNVKQWVGNVEEVLSRLDPQNADLYAGNAAAYLARLDELETFTETSLATIPENNRFLVTNHDSLQYFAEAYGFTVLDTVIPAASTLAEPSAADLAQLISTMETHGTCTIFSEASASDEIAKTAAGELSGCAEVQLLPLYTGALGPPGSGADSYIGMFRSNVETIVQGLGS